jgi:hypothetical protein
MNPTILAITLFGAGTIALAALWFWVLRPVGNSVLGNGGFESNSAAFRGGVTSVMGLTTGATELSPWAVTGPRIGWSRENGTPRGLGSVAPQEGEFFVDLANHDQDRPARSAPGGIQQDVPLDPDRDYLLEAYVWAKASNGNTGVAQPATIRVTVANNGVVRYDKTRTSPGGGKWERLSFGFDTGGWTTSGGRAPASITITAPPGQQSDLIGVDGVSLRLQLPILRRFL